MTSDYLVPIGQATMKYARKKEGEMYEGSLSFQVERERDGTRKITWMNFCLMGPRRLMPGWISASGLAVSTLVDTIATNQPLLATYTEK